MSHTVNCSILFTDLPLLQRPAAAREAGFDAVIEAHAADFGHIQVADAPGRNEPGTGELPLQRWIVRSRELGYTGCVGLEYKASQQDPFAWLCTAATA